MSEKGRKKYNITKRDCGWMLLIVLVYSILSFINLGVFQNPQVFWEPRVGDDYAVIKLSQVEEVSKIRHFTGFKFGDYKLYASDDGEAFRSIGDLKQEKVFAWKDREIKERFKYLAFRAQDPTSALGEIVLYGEGGQQLEATYHTENAKPLVDEGDLVPQRISYLNSTYFDEIYHARTAYEYVHQLEIYEWTHPPLGKLLMSIPLYMGGMNPFSYRLMGNLAGILMLPVIYILAKKLFGHTRYGILAAILLSADGMHFVQTRIATVDSFLVLFIMLSFLFMYVYMRCPDDDHVKRKLIYLCLSGIFIGAAVATKWSAAYGAIGLAILFFINLIRRNRDKLYHYEWIKQQPIIILSCFVFFLIIPACIYIGSYIPFFVKGEGHSFQEFIELQLKMYHYHADLVATHPYSSPWYLWPLNIKPVWYYKGTAIEGYISTIVAMGNPIIWWSGIVAIGYTFFRSLFQRKQRDIFILIAVLALYLPYAFIPRIMFLYHYFPVVPFMILALTSLLKDIAENMKKGVILKWYGAIVVGSFIFFYPIYSGADIPLWYASMTRWLPIWQYY